ncbi:hypothetical protein FPOA_06785 [Fusarium poae]|uniref:NACHT domain-containing protein n=1 Tax=Fusarium poae TaxID=36050 RepID=A0A1B8AIM1_FUSPO|nr:hypothetical protein FPOA_06785 [Fusarium poae]
MNDHFETFNQEFEVLQLHTEAASRDKDAEERSSAQQERLNAEVARNVLLRIQAKTSEFGSLLLAQKLNDLVNRAKQWLAPPSYADELEELQRSRCDGTGEWLFSDFQFINWKNLVNNTGKESGPEAESTLECPVDPSLDTTPALIPKGGGFQFNIGEDRPEDKLLALSEGVEEAAPLLWIQGRGNPGAGKSVLAACTVEFLSFHADDIPVFYFFFREEDPSMRSSLAALRSILAQFLSKHAHLPQIVDSFALAMTSNSSGQPTGTQDELGDLLLLLFGCIGDCFIVLDGLDECEDEDVLLQVLNLLVKNSLCRIIVFSRPILRHGVAGKDGEVLQIGLRNQNDIETFLRNNIHALISKSYFPQHTDEEFILQRLKLGSDGMFLWARLMIGYLQLPVLTRTRRMKTIMDVNLPEGLEQMYDRLMDIINSKLRIERSFALLVLSLTTYAVRPLTCREMAEVLKIPSLGENEEGGDYPDLHNTIMMACSGLIERATLNDSRYTKPTSAYRLIHLSAKEYFTSTNVTTNPRGCTGESSNPYLSAVQTHFHLAIRCLRYLMYHVPAQQLSGIAGRISDSRTLDESFPLLDYATGHWTVHLGLINDINATFRCVASLPDQQEWWYHECANSLVNFLQQKKVLMVWIESCYASGQVPSFGKVVRWLNMFGNDNREQLQKDSREFEAYLQALETEWGSKLLASPSLVWGEVLAFTPCRLLPGATEMKVKSLIYGRPKGKKLFSRHLCKISELTVDGKWVVVLSIWPSRYNAGRYFA